MLFRLLKLQRENEGIAIKGLREQIAEARATMSEEDTAKVEKEIAALYD